MNIIKDTEPNEAENKQTALQKKLTFDPTYIKDREKIDALSRTVQNQILQLNKRLEVIQITHFKFRIEEPAEEAKKAKKIKRKRKFWALFWGK